MADQKSKKRSSNAPWSYAELQTSVDAYQYMLQLEASDIPFSATEQEKLLISGPLSNRNDASVRYRLRNISHVMQERGEATLKAYSAAPQVGSNVRARIHDLLDEKQDTPRSVKQMVRNHGAKAVTLDDVLAGLDQLEDLISSLKTEPSVVAGIGHNNPPEEIVIDAEDLADALQEIVRIKTAVANDAPDISTVKSGSSTLVRLGMKSVLWAGQRLNDFAKAGAMTAGTSTVLSISDLGGQIIETLCRVFTFLF